MRFIAVYIDRCLHVALIADADLSTVYMSIGAHGDFYNTQLSSALPSLQHFYLSVCLSHAGIMSEGMDVLDDAVSTTDG